MQARSILLAIWVLFATVHLHAEDWPAWKHDARRSGSTTEKLSKKLSLQWKWSLSPLKPAWPDQAKMQMDAHYEPIVIGKLLIVGSSFDDTVQAYSTETGKVEWRFHANGPVRYSPLGWNGNVYFTSDDGHLYCVKAKTGELVWKHRGSPVDRRALGNDRLISAWPARGAPVIADDVVYYAAGIWPFQGIFIHALDAKTGKVIWTNDGDGSIYIKQPHNADSFAGVAPQGPLVVVGDKLLIPGGRSVPACYDRKTGKLLYYEIAQNGKRGGGSAVAANESLIFNGGALFELKTEKYLGTLGDQVVFTKERIYGVKGGDCIEYDLKGAGFKTMTVKDRKGKTKKVTVWKAEQLGSAETGAIQTLLLTADRLYVGGENFIRGYDLPLAKSAKPSWEAKVKGEVRSLLAADEKLFAVTLEGGILCFGAKEASPTYLAPATNAWSTSKETEARLNALLKKTQIEEGYGLIWEPANLEMSGTLLQKTKLRILHLDSNAKRAHKHRDSFRSAGYPSERATAHVLDLETTSLSPYFASLMIAEADFAQKLDVAGIKKQYQILRPFGGTLCVEIEKKDRPAFLNKVKQAKLVNGKIEEFNEWVLIRREGALPGSANYTHENGDAQNTRVSKDKLVKAPFGVLWFGGSSHTGILPRHGHGPQPQVVDGQLFIEGIDMIRSMDIYTGRVIWEAKLPGVGDFYNKTSHESGANASNTNYVSTREGIYVAYKNSCVVLDPATGKKLKTLELPRASGEKEAPRWGYVSVYKDYLIGGGDPLVPPKGTKLSRATNDTFSSSARLVVMNRHTGKVLWQMSARQGFRHNAIVCGNGTLFCVDRLSGPQVDRLKRRGKKPEHPYRLLALDLNSGKEIWKTEKDVFGTWLSYSVEHDILVEAGRVARDGLGDEPKGMRAWSGKSGKVIWADKGLSGPAMIRGDVILLVGKACELKTGKPWMRKDPLTGKMVEWTWKRTYGCNTPAASEHLLTFRSGAAGYYDLCNDSGTGNFGGFRSGCSNNLIVAGGILNAPDYTRTCQCSYQNQTSLALIHLPEEEMWTFYGAKQPGGAIQRVGLNFAAPGDRKSDEGILWVEYPSVAGQSPTFPVEISPEGVQKARRHSSQISGEGYNWVTSSALVGVSELKITLDPDATKEKKYRVKLYFAELENVQQAERVFDVSLQGKTVLKQLDVRKESGALRRGLVKEVQGVAVRDVLTVTLTPSRSAKIKAPLICGIEIVREN